MPATNYTPILLYRTATASTTAPAAGNLNFGELAINYNASGMILYAKNASGSVIKLMNNPANLLYPTADGSPNQVIVTNGSGTLSFASVTASPGGSTTQVQYNNAGAFGGISNATTDGTTLSMTSPKVITGINDTNGNELLKVTATASAVNELTLANAATGGNPVLSATGGDTNIGITLTPKGTGGVVFPAGAVGTPAITTTGDTNTGVFFPAADTAAITTGGSERMRVDSSGRVLINTTTSIGGNNKLQVVDDGTANIQIFTGRADQFGPQYVTGKSRGTTASPTIVQLNDDLGALVFRGYDGASYINGAKIEAQVDATPGSNDMPGRLTFWTTADGAASATERMRISADGTIKTSSTISVGGATPSTSGAGITFPATQSASSDANTLDDYEEGTFTPTITASGGGSPTYSDQTGIYTKIGRAVSVYLYVGFSKNTLTGNIKINGLPFTIGSGSAMNNCQYWYIPSGTNIYSLMAYSGGSNTTLDLYKVTAATIDNTGSTFTASDINSAAYLHFNFVYYV